MAQTQITDVLGRVRDVQRTWPNGSWECPFCCSAVDPERDRCRGTVHGYRNDCDGALHCQNPACFANPHYPVERAREVLATEERKRAEEARRLVDRAWAKKYAEGQAQARAEKIRSIQKEAQARGACIRCALKDAPYRESKFIKHRTRCPLEPRS